MKIIARKAKSILSICIALMMVVSVVPAASLNVYAEEAVTENFEANLIADDVLETAVESESDVAIADVIEDDANDTVLDGLDDIVSDKDMNETEEVILEEDFAEPEDIISDENEILEEDASPVEEQSLDASDDYFSAPQNIQFIYDRAGKPIQAFFEMDPSEEDCHISFTIVNEISGKEAKETIEYFSNGFPYAPNGNKRVNIDFRAISLYGPDLYNVIEIGSKLKIKIWAWSEEIEGKKTSSVSEEEFGWFVDNQRVDISFETDIYGEITGYARLRCEEKPNEVSLRIITSGNYGQDVNIGTIDVSDVDYESGISIDVRRFIGYEEAFRVYACVDGKTYMSDLGFTRYSPFKKCPDPINICWHKKDNEITSISWEISVNTDDISENEYDFLGTFTNLTTGEKFNFTYIDNDYSHNIFDVKKEAPDGFFVSDNKYKVEIVACAKRGPMHILNSNTAESIYSFSNGSSIDVELDSIGEIVYTVADDDNIYRNILFEIERDNLYIAEDTVLIDSEMLNVQKEYDVRRYLTDSGVYTVKVYVNDKEDYINEISFEYQKPEESASEPYDISWLYDLSGKLYAVTWFSYSDTFVRLTGENTDDRMEFTLPYVHGGFEILFDNRFSDLLANNSKIKLELVSCPSKESCESIDEYGISNVVESEFVISSEVEQAVTVSLEYDGYIQLHFDAIPNDNTYEVTLYKGEEEIYSEQFEVYKGSMYQSLIIAKYLTTSGTYKAKAVVDGMEYWSDEWKYERPERIHPKADNITWLALPSGQLQVNFDVNFEGLYDEYEDYNVDYYAYYTLTNLTTGQKKSYTQLLFKYMNDGDFVTEHISLTPVREIFAKESDYEIDIILLSAWGVLDIAASEPSKSIYIYAEETATLNGPKDIEMNIKTGELSFTTNDSSDGDSKISYGFSLLRDGEFIKYIPYSFSESGETAKVSFAGLYDEPGEYVINIFARIDKGEPDRRKELVYKFNYTRPQEQIATPANVKLKGTVVSWDRVSGAVGYQVKVNYTDRTQSALEYYIEIAEPNNSADIAVFASDSYKDVKVSVRAISEDAMTIAASDFSKTIDYKEEEVPSISSYYGYAFPARDKSLGNVKLYNNDIITASLPEGWEWLKPSDDLTRYLVGNVYPFTVVYHSQHGDIYENIAVLLLNPSTDEFDSIKANQIVGKTENVSFSYDKKVFTDDEIRLVSSNPNVLNVEKYENGEFALTAIKNGTVTLSYYVANVVVANKKINVIAGDSLSGEDDIEVTIKNSDGVPVSFDESIDIELTEGARYTIEAVAEIKDGEEIIKSFTTNITSSDASVLKVSNGVKLTKADKANLTFVGAGYAYVTVTANDALKTKRTIKIHVTDKSDSAVILEKNELVLNTQKKDVEDSFFVYDGGERELKGVEIYNAKLFDKKCKPIGDLTPSESLVAVNSGNRVIVRLVDGATIETGKYVVGLKFDEEKDVYRFITIKKVSTKPSVKVTQESVPDFAEEYQTTVFRLSGNVGDFENVDIEGMDTDFYRTESGPGYALLNVYKFHGKKKLKLTIQTSEYKDFTVNVDVKTTTSKFALSATTVTLYPDVEGSYFDIKIKNSTKKTVLIDDMADVTLSDSDNYDINYVGNGIYRINVKEGATPALSKKVVLKYYDNSLAEELSFNLTIKTVKFANTKLELGAKKLTMYNYIDKDVQVDTTLRLSGGCDALELFSNVEITEKVGKNKAPALNETLDVSYDSNTGRIVVKKLSDELKAGTYNFVIKLNNDTLSKGSISVILPVKVVNVDGLTSKTKASVKVTAKNNVNLFNRENTSVVCTPKFTNVPVDAVYRIVDITGKDYSLFSIKDEKNIILKDFAVILEKQTYVINLVYEVEANGAIVRVTSSDINLKFKTKKASVNLINNGTNIFDYNGSTMNLRLEAGYESKPISIKAFKLTNMLSSFECTGNTIIGDEHVALIDVTSLADAQLQKGKTYTLKFNVYMKGAALDSKPVTISYKVKIAK